MGHRELPRALGHEHLDERRRLPPAPGDHPLRGLRGDQAAEPPVVDQVDRQAGGTGRRDLAGATLAGILLDEELGHDAGGQGLTDRLGSLGQELAAGAAVLGHQ